MRPAVSLRSWLVRAAAQLLSLPLMVSCVHGKGGAAAAMADSEEVRVRVTGIRDYYQRATSDGAHLYASGTAVDVIVLAPPNRVGLAFGLRYDSRENVPADWAKVGNTLCATLRVQNLDF